MDESPISRLLRIRVLSLLIAAFCNAVIGAWAAVDPSSFYIDFPGFGGHWVAIMGTYDEHLVVDTGLLFLALTVTLVAGLVRSRNLTLVRVASLSALTFAGLHFAFHVSHLSGFTAGEATGEIAGLAVLVAAPAVALVTTLPNDGRRAARSGLAEPVDLQCREQQYGAAADGAGHGLRQLLSRETVPAWRMRPGPTSHLRIARPSRHLDQAERFWVEGLGLQVLYRATAHAEGGHALLMLGWREAPWHLELVGDPDEEIPSDPSDEDLLVLYVGGAIEDELVERLIVAGGRPVAARNPYWDRWGITILDPDGYRLVLSHRSWP